MSCFNFPECTGSRNEKGKEFEGPKEVGRDCPKCLENESLKIEDKGRLVVREGRFGKFISCSLYPKCKYIEEDEEVRKKNSTGVQCNLCQKGEMVKRIGRFGEFYSCSNYPDCKNIIKTKPTGKNCLECGKLMMVGTKTIPDRCSDKSCILHRPDRLSEGKQKIYGIIPKAKNKKNNNKKN